MSTAHTVTVTPGSASSPACIHVRSASTEELIGSQVADKDENPALFYAVQRIADLEARLQDAESAAAVAVIPLGQGESREEWVDPADYMARRDLLLEAEALEKAAKTTWRGFESTGDEAWRIALLETAKSKRFEAERLRGQAS